MRQRRGVLLPTLRGSRPRRATIYRALRAAVLDAILGPGERLPSTRQAAADYGVSRGVLEAVYAQLADDGFLERAVGRGTFVAAALSRLEQPPRRSRALPGRPAPSRRGAAVAANAACREPPAPRPFNAGIADTSEFPWRVWRRLNARAARALERSGLDFSDPRGLPELRAAIARLLAHLRGIRCSPDQVVVFNSAQQALGALAVLLIDSGESVWIEDPCYLGARAAFELAGAALVPVPVDEAGLCVERGLRSAPRARLAYVTPSHQYPMGVSMALERRLALLEWARRQDAWVLEDDYDGELRYEGQPLLPLHALDTQGRVIYLGTLNKALFVSLRLAYAVVPPELVEPLANVRSQLDGFTPPERQAALAFFIEEGRFSAHLRRMRAVYGAKRSELVAGLAPLQPLGWTWSSNPVGLHVMIRHARGDYVRSVAAASRLDLALLSRYRAARRSDDGLFLRFGALDAASLRDGALSLVALAKRLAPRRGAEVP